MTKDDSKNLPNKDDVYVCGVCEGQMPTVGFRILLLAFETGFVLSLEFAMLA